MFWQWDIFGFYVLPQSLVCPPDPVNLPVMMEAGGVKVTPTNPADLSSHDAEQISEGALSSGHQPVKCAEMAGREHI